MAIDAHGQSLEQLLTFRETLPAEAFVLDVMQRVRREQRRRNIILFAFGLVGAAFGLAGAFLLAGPVAGIFSKLPVMATMQAVLLAVAALAFYVWSMNEDLGLPN
ncbi:MAG TPA: hypothetical protein VI566_07820 [Xanthomonadales bacterium]|nr:hypothetical protein [Xanthomonadales bacterium]